MNIFHFLEAPKIQGPVDLAFGTFDGLHRGHLALLKQLQEGRTLLTFENHPQAFLTQKPIPWIISFAQKCKLLKMSNLENLILLSFTKELAELSAEMFIEQILDRIPLKSLVLGDDARMGKNREGDERVLRQIAQKRGFELIYIPSITWEGKRVSSRGIRDLIEAGKLEEASSFLGREYSLGGEVERGEGKGGRMGYKTANLSLEGLCHPPQGVYAVHARIQDKLYSGIANLGVAPTLKQRKGPLLEVHLFTQESPSFYGEEIEVFFKKYLRQERAFPTLEALKRQIAEDIQLCKNSMTSPSETI